MRKRYKRMRSCAVCHPNKTGNAPRWTEKDLERLRRWERERREWEGHRVSDALDGL